MGLFRQHHGFASDGDIKHSDWTLQVREIAMYVFTYRYTYKKL